MKFTLTFEVGDGTGISTFTDLRYALQGIAARFYGATPFQVMPEGTLLDMDGKVSDVTATLGPKES